MKRNIRLICVGAGLIFLAVGCVIGGSILLSAYDRLGPEEKKDGNEIFKKQVSGITLLIFAGIGFLVGIPILVASSIRHRRENRTPERTPTPNHPF